ncbi:tyrosine recombinase [Corynebacterium kutscheri]|uniref:Tyrosine recombinase n=1 Tax=Corynebacterium kutscheri TaxID=35755 RepID=A0A0F6TEH9_9CORY|nr:hypothetical protein UL82_10250 [Corynebacterium kutscheri]VEH05808.1 tyrosine recombinase [Corynebacterium kutscheri]VEH10527.1 tyrosine recombinase [Corynebacterium kutscheri]VEH81701.1 tyrosine recombinase [Corynebacterium kutscheri]
MGRDPEFARIVPHGLRHIMAEFSISGYEGCVKIGHTSVSMTLDVHADFCGGCG